MNWELLYLCIGKKKQITQGISITKANKSKIYVYIFGEAFAWNSNRYKADNSRGQAATKK